MLEVCRQLKYHYFTYYSLSKDQCETNHWIADRGTMFARHDAFIQRCDDLLHLCKTAQQFEKMSTVVIGGNSGAGLTNDIEGVFKEFNKIFDKMKSCGYDCLDVDETKFESDILKFSTGVKELEVRIAKVLGSGFEEAVTVSSGFKLVDSFGEMLERDFVQSYLESKKLELILIYADELKEVQELFTRDKTGVSSKGKFFQREGPPLYTNMPPVSGALAWVQGLIHRLQDPMKALMGTLQKMEDTDEVEDVKRTHDSILASLVDYEDQMFQAWDGTVDKTLGDKLTLPLLVKDERSQEITVYFDQELLKLLNECKYLTLQKKDIPQIAKEHFAQAEIFRVQMANLTLVQNMYNEMLRKMLDVEKPLLKAKMKAIDKVLARGLKDLVWQSPNTDKDAFITEINALVVDAHQTLFQMKANSTHTQRPALRTSKVILRPRGGGDAEAGGAGTPGDGDDGATVALDPAAASLLSSALQPMQEEAHSNLPGNDRVGNIEAHTELNACTLPLTLLQQASVAGDRCFIQVWSPAGGVSLSCTFSELADCMLGAAAWLHDEIGLQRAEYVAMLARNSVGYLAVFFGAMALGAATLNLNWRNPEEVTARLVQWLQPKLLVASEPFHEQAGTLHTAMGVRVTLLEAVCTTALATLPFSRPATDVAATLTATICALDPSSTAAVFFTGGTTGTPKAVPHSHTGLLWLARSTLGAMPAPFAPSVAHTGTVCFTPFFHVMGFCANLCVCSDCASHHRVDL